jgi:hypothetical protein
MTRRVIPVLAACLLLSGISGAALYAQQPAPPARTATSTHPQTKAQTDDKEKQEKEKKVRTVQGTIGQIEGGQSTGPNVRIEVTLTEQQGTSTTSKTVMLTTGNGQWGKLRSQVFRSGTGPAPLNLDARPVVLKDGRISVSMTVEYSPDASGPLASLTRNDPGVSVTAENGKATTIGTGQTHFDQSLTVVLQDGQPLLVTQSADAVSDRKVTVQVTATVLK